MSFEIIFIIRKTNNIPIVVAVSLYFKISNEVD